jgi:hypothetical protein
MAAELQRQLQRQKRWTRMPRILEGETAGLLQLPYPAVLPFKIRSIRVEAFEVAVAVSAALCGHLRFQRLAIPIQRISRLDVPTAE